MNVAVGPSGGSAISREFIENPVDHISVTTTMRAPPSAAAAMRGRIRRKFASVSSQTMSCWIAATFTRRPPSGPGAA